MAEEIGAHFAMTDVTSEDSVKAAIALAMDKMGKINAAINCAGVGTAEKTLGREGPHSLDHYNRVIGINLVGTFNVARLAAGEERPHRGRPARRDRQYRLGCSF